MEQKKSYYILIVLLISSITYAQTIRLNIEGNSANETATIDSIGYIKSFNDYANLKAELDSTLLKLERLGYYNKILKSFKKENDSTYNAKIELQTQYRFIHIYYNNLNERELIFDLLDNSEEEYFKLNINEIETTLNYLISKISELGDPFYSLQLLDIEALNENTLRANLISYTTKNRSIDKIIVRGYERFPESFIKHFLKLQTKKTFNINSIKKRTSEISTLIFAKQRKEPEVLFTNDSTILYLYVDKEKSNTFDGFLGFGTDEETNKLQFDGYLNLNLVNNLNYGESFNLYYKSDESEQRTFNVNVEMPFLFNTPLGIESSLNIFKRDSTFLTTTTKVNMVYRLSPKFSSAAGLSKVKSDNLINASLENIEDFNSIFYNLQLGYTSINTNELLFPVNFYFDFEFGIGKRNTSIEEIPQYQFNIESFKVFNLNAKNSIYSRLTGGYLISDNYLTNELYRFGGINSIRGFKENSLFANLYSVLNTEYRYKINRTFYIHSVLDASYSENKIADTKDKLFGFGFGFGLLTNSGLLKFNYSGSKVNDQIVKFSDFKIHISLSASF